MLQRKYLGNELASVNANIFIHSRRSYDADYQPMLVQVNSTGTLKWWFGQHQINITIIIVYESLSGNSVAEGII